VTELRRLRQLEEENRKLKQLVAYLSLDKVMLRDVLSNSSEAHAGKRLVGHLMDRFRIGVRPARESVRQSLRQPNTEFSSFAGPRARRSSRVKIGDNKKRPTQ
jgi:hypothetical protein